MVAAKADSFDPTGLRRDTDLTAIELQREIGRLIWPNGWLALGRDAYSRP